VSDGDAAPPPKRGTAPPLFGPCLLWPNSRPFQQLLYSSRQRVAILYNRPPLPPNKMSIRVWKCGPPSNTWFPVPTRVHIPNGISIGSVVFAGLTIVTDRLTDRLRYSVCNSRPYLSSTAMRPRSKLWYVCTSTPFT